MATSSSKPSDETQHLVLAELYNEIRDRRNFVLKLVTRYIGGCAVVLGWIITISKPISAGTRCALAGFVVLVGLTLIYVLEGHSKTYAETAKTIVRLSDSMRLFEKDFFPTCWHNWGSKVVRWPQIAVGLIGLATSVFLIVYR